MKSTLISLLLFTLFVFARSQGVGELDFRDTDHTEEKDDEFLQPQITQAPEALTKPPSKKPRRTTILPIPLAKTESPEPEIREECSDRFDIVIPVLSTCTKCTSNTDCKSSHVCCPVTDFPLLPKRDSNCCVIKRPPKPTTAAPATN